MKSQLLTLSGLFVFCLFCFQACAQSKDGQKEPRNITAQYTGEIDNQDMSHSEYTSKWYEAVYKSYNTEAEKEAIKTIKEHINDYDIIAFMGTWCPDSKREVPKLYKILEEVDYDLGKVKMYTLNHMKKSDEGVEKDWNITNIPTIIFLKDGKEVNRFVEHARQSLAQDIAKIVSGESYKHYHQR